MKKKIFLSSGRNDSYQLGHDKSDGFYHEMKVIPQNLQIKKVECGRSHVIFQTFDDELYALGRNDHGQCGVQFGEIGDSYNAPPVTTLTQCLNNETKSTLQNVNDFSVGWFHTTVICNNYTKILYTGTYINNRNKSAFSEHAEMKLKENCKKFTKISSGCHCFAVVMDDRYILFKDINSITKEYDLFKIVNASNNLQYNLQRNLQNDNFNNLQNNNFNNFNNHLKITDLQCTSSGFLFLTNENICYFSCNDNENGGIGGYGVNRIKNNQIVKICTSGASMDVSLKLLKNGLNYYKSFEEQMIEVGNEIGKEFDVIPFYYSYQFYNREERRLYATSGSGDGQLGIGLPDSGVDGYTPVNYVNELLKNNPNYEITIHPGCDFSVIVLEEQETREEKRTKSVLFCQLNNLLSDVNIV
ncbi:hypothetical protein ABK040_006946 [Willaertia magna]